MNVYGRGLGSALALLCGMVASSVHAQAQDPGAMAEQLLGALLQAGTRAGTGMPAELGGANAQPAAQGAAQPEDAPPRVQEPLPPQTIYRYRNKAGREVFTNSAEQIPEQERERARVDLSHITLNTELGSELNKRLEQRYEKLVASPRCEQLREDAKLGFVERLWEDYAPLVVCGAVLLLFILATPSALRSVGGPIWARTLMMAIPALAIGGLVTFSMRETALALSELKKQAKPCEPGQFASLQSAPDAVMRRAALVRQLQAMVVPVPSTGELPPAPAIDTPSPVQRN